MGYQSIVSAAAISSGYTSPVQDIQKSTGIAIECVFSGTTLSGSVAVQTSIGLGSWSTLVSTTVSAAGIVEFNLPLQYTPYYKVVWTDTGSSGNAAMTITSYSK